MSRRAFLGAAIAVGAVGVGAITLEKSATANAPLEVPPSVVAEPAGIVDIGGSLVRVAAAAAQPVGTPVEVLVRRESTALVRPGQPGIPGTVISQQFQGARIRLLVHPRHLPDPTAVIISDLSGTRHDDWVSGTEVSIAIDAESALVHPR